MTIEEALAQKDGKNVSITGTVTVINTEWSEQYKNISVTITDENGKSILLFRLSANVGIGDLITVNGTMATHDDIREIAQGGIAVEIIPHVCSEFTELTCTEASKCKLCGKVNEEAPGHNYVNHKCSVCGKRETVVTNVATFDFGENGTNTQHVDGNSLGASKSYTVGNYTLALTGMSSVYGPAYDLQHNSAIKLGTSSKTGTFSFTVPDDVTKVVIYVAGYKANKASVVVNGITYEISTTSNNGEYTAIEVDTSVTKTVAFATNSSPDERAMVNTIEFYAEQEIPCEHTNKITQGAADATCTKPGYTGDLYCPDCETTLEKGEEIAILEHPFGDWTVVKAATEEEDGIQQRTCSACGKVEEDIIPKLSHVHTEETIPAVAPTCTETGLTAGVKCSTCGEIITAQEEVPANGHTEVVDEAKAPTCTATGLTEGKHCEVCKEVLVAQEEVAMADHSYVDHICEDCGKEDPDHYFEMTIEEALAAADGKKVSVTGTVVEINTPFDDYYQNITVTIADENGKTLYIYRLSANVGLGDVITVKGAVTTFYDNKQIAQGATAEIIVKHTCSEYTEATCTEAAKCVVCGTVNGDPIDHTYVNGVCSCGAVQGVENVTESMNIYANKGTVSGTTITWTSGDVTFTNAQNTSSTAIRTSDSDHFRAYQGSKTTISCSNITKVVITCTSSSYATVCANSLTTAGATATVNGSVVTITVTSGTLDSIELVATGQWRLNNVEVTYNEVSGTCEHDYVETTEEATCTEAGSISNICSKCGDTEVIEILPVTGHTYGEWVETTAPTCTEKGEQSKTCSSCGDVQKETILATGHNFVDGTCTGCGESETDAPEVEPIGQKTYTFSNYAAGTQYAAGEVHKLDEYVTVTTTESHFTSELRLYSSSTHNGYAIFETAAAVKGISFNAGYKVDTLNVYGSTDGETWVLIEGISITSTSYNDYTVNVPADSAYTFIKLDVAGTQQVRIKSITFNLA